ncbi:MAG: PD40 domain-containing protein [Acidobacteriaceae bacterium]|nr:PD40 domain-containing protein [Acidobacteriaceae bacterium]
MLTCTHQWLTDGSILFMGADARTFYLLPPSGDRKPARLLRTQSAWVDPQVSQDGKWIAYSSRESGRSEIYIAAFPSFTERRQVSNGGGVGARWRKDGNELFFLSLENELMSLDVKRGAALTTGVPRILFKTPFAVDSSYQYSVTGNGKRFIFNEPVKEASQPFTVVLNWAAGLKQ